MDDDEQLRFERCGLCLLVFCVCRPCYRGHSFCGRPCKVAARTRSKRAARARHRRTLEGRLDHRDPRESAASGFARGRSQASVADQGPRFLDPVASVSTPRDPPSPMSGTVAIDGVALRRERADIDADALFAHPRATVDLEGFRSVRADVHLDHGSQAYNRVLTYRCSTGIERKICPESGRQITIASEATE